MEGHIIGLCVEHIDAEAVEVDQCLLFAQGEGIAAVFFFTQVIDADGGIGAEARLGEVII